MISRAVKSDLLFSGTGIVPQNVERAAQMVKRARNISRRWYRHNYSIGFVQCDVPCYNVSSFPTTIFQETLMTTSNSSPLAEPDYRLLFEEHPMPMLIYALDSLAFLAVNDVAITHYGYSRAEFLALNITDIAPQEDRSKLLTFLTQAKPNMENAGGWRHRKKSGELIEVELTIKDIPFEDHPARLVIVNDVTKFLRSEQALQQSEHRLSSIISSAMVKAVLTDIEPVCSLRGNRFY